MQSIRKISNSLFGNSSFITKTSNPKQQQQKSDEKHDAEMQPINGAILRAAPANNQISRSGSLKQQQPHSANLEIKVIEQMENMKLENQRLELDIARLEQQLNMISEEKKNNDNMRLTIEALQTQIRLLVEELHRVNAESAKRTSAAGATGGRRFSTGDLQGDKKEAIELNNKFVARLQKELEMSIKRLVETGEVKPVWSVILNARREIKQSEKMTQTEVPQLAAGQKYIPKRILYRPSRIMIPMVRIHDARMQEIELLRAAGAQR